MPLVKIKIKKLVGKQADKDAWAEGQSRSSAADEIYPHFDVDFASGGLAYLLGE